MQLNDQEMIPKAVLQNGCLKLKKIKAVIKANNQLLRYLKDNMKRTIVVAKWTTSDNTWYGVGNISSTGYAI